jgi:tRNA nucleotidyltransferase (CCA-adding enzyme)
MVGKAVAVKREIDGDGLARRTAALPGFGAVRDAAERSGVAAYLVGGAVRDALIGHSAPNLDLVVVADPRPLIEALAGDARVHDRFATATVAMPEGPVDVARARTETYEHPGALPAVAPASDLEADLARRDFSVNAIAVPVGVPGRLIDPHSGVDDLGAGVLRVLHERSFADDPTRALRAARYAARLGLELEPATRELLRDADLTTVSADRVDAELRRIAAEPSPRGGFELLDGWGLVPLAAGAAELIDAVAAVCEREPWRGEVDRAAAVLAAARGPARPAHELAELEPASPSQAVAAAHGHDAVDLALARALGATWLDDYLADWRDTRLEITGEDLLEAGIGEGPAVGRGLAAALRAKLDGETDGREAELEAALEAARRG